MIVSNEDRTQVDDGFGIHDLSHEHEYKVGDRFASPNYLGESGTIVGLGHIQPKMENAGYDGKQTFRASQWYEVKGDSGKTNILNPERMRPERS